MDKPACKRCLYMNELSDEINKQAMCIYLPEWIPVPRKHYCAQYKNREGLL